MLRESEDELGELWASAPGLVVLSGVEVSAREGHILVYGGTDRYWTDSFGLARKEGDVIDPGAGNDTVDPGYDARRTSPGVSVSSGGTGRGWPSSSIATKTK